ncbi:MAG: hypothetical protein ACR2NP_08860 [Pirellulaceae bacterium]
MKKLLLKLQLAVAALLVASAPLSAVAQTDMDMEPGVVISMASLEEHLSDMEHLVEAAGFGQMAGLVRMGAAEYIRGLDPDKPMGSFLFFHEDTPEPDVLAFVPVKDIEDVLDTLAPFVDIDEDGNDIVLTANDGTEITVREREGYAFIVQDAAMLENLPANPASQLENLPSQYNFAARIFGQRIPAELRQQAIDLIRDGAAAEMENLGDSPEAELQRANFDYSMAQLEAFINETEEVIVGLGIDEEGNRVLIDMTVIGLPDSRLARQSQVLADAPESQFKGFLLEGSAANFHISGKMLDDDIEDIQTMIESLTDAAQKQIDEELSGDEAELAKRIVSDLIEVVQASVAKGYMNAGGSLVLNDDSAALAFGTSIAEGAKLEDSVKEIASYAEEEDVPVEFRFDVRSDNGVRYHEIDVMIPDSEEEMRAMFGDKLSILLGVSDDALYLAAGKEPADLLTRCMQGSGIETDAVVHMDLHLLPILRFISNFQDAGELEGIADILPETADDRMRFTVDAVENGQTFRFEMQDAVLQILGALGQSMGGGFGPPQDF